MDPVANLERQRQLVAEILAFTKGAGPLDRAIKGYSADAEYTASAELRGLTEELAELTQALDEWRLKGGFDPYLGDDDLDPTFREYAIRGGRMLLYWGGLEDLSGTHLSPEGLNLVDAYMDAIGNSSIPEAARTVADSLGEES